jgi:hypothetical protein
MLKWFRELDRILRGEATQVAELQRGDVPVQVGGLSLTLALLGVFYGLCMGVFAMLNRPTPEFQQVFAAMVKVPALFFLTLLVTFPSLYVFNALVGSRLSAGSLLRLLVAALGVNLAVLASFGPIVAFFSLTTPNYPFMVLLNVFVFAIAGFLGLVFLLQTLFRLSVAETIIEALPVEPAVVPEEAAVSVVAPAPPGALDALPGHVLGRRVRIVFRCWLLVFALVGAQMAWVLRPFIGNPEQPFAWFRVRESSFFEAVWRAVQALFR